MVAFREATPARLAAFSALPEHPATHARCAPCKVQRKALDEISHTWRCAPNGRRCFRPSLGRALPASPAAVKSLCPRPDGPCRKSLRIVAIDITNYGEVATRHDVQVLPTLVVYTRGQPVERMVRLRPEEPRLSAGPGFVVCPKR